MVKRIIFDSTGVRVSRAGFDAATASRENLLMHPNMEDDAAKKAAADEDKGDSDLAGAPKAKAKVDKE